MYSTANQMTDDLQFAALTARMVAVEDKLPRSNRYSRPFRSSCTTLLKKSLPRANDFPAREARRRLGKVANDSLRSRPGISGSWQALIYFGHSARGCKRMMTP